MGCCCAKSEAEGPAYVRFECVDEFEDDQDVKSPVTNQFISRSIEIDSKNQYVIHGKFGGDFYKGQISDYAQSRIFLDIKSGKLEFQTIYFNVEQRKSITAVFSQLRGVTNSFILQPYTWSVHEDRLITHAAVAEGKNLNYCLFRFNYKVPEEIVTFFTAQIVLGLNFLHKHHIVHGNLILRNILLFKDGYIKISGFDYSVVSTGRTKLRVGILEFLAPEVLQDKLCDTAVDWWSLGIGMSILLGCYPFDISRVRDSIIIDEPIFPTEASILCKRFMKELLNKNQNERFTNIAEEQNIFRDPIFKSTQWQNLAKKK